MVTKLLSSNIMRTYHFKDSPKLFSRNAMLRVSQHCQNRLATTHQTTIPFINKDFFLNIAVNLKCLALVKSI